MIPQPYDAAERLHERVMQQREVRALEALAQSQQPAQPPYDPFQHSWAQPQMHTDEEFLGGAAIGVLLYMIIAFIVNVIKNIKVERHDET